MTLIDWKNLVAWISYFYRDTIETPDGVHLLIFLSFMVSLLVVVRLKNSKLADAAECAKRVTALQVQNRHQEIALAMLYGLIRANHPAKDFPSIDEVLSGDVGAVQRLVPGFTPTTPSAAATVAPPPEY